MPFHTLWKANLELRGSNNSLAVAAPTSPVLPHSLSCSVRTVPFASEYERSEQENFEPRRKASDYRGFLRACRFLRKLIGSVAQGFLRALLLAQNIERNVSLTDGSGTDARVASRVLGSDQAAAPGHGGSRELKCAASMRAACCHRTAGGELSSRGRRGLGEGHFRFRLERDL